MTQTLLSLAADMDTQLAVPVAVSDTTATLVSATDDDSVALPAGTYGFTIDAGNASKEYIICSLSSTALTNIYSISRQGVATAGFARAHRRGAKVAITDWAILSRMLKLLNGTTNFDSGTPLGYDGAPASLVSNQFATVNYVLSVVTGGTVAFDQQVAPNQTAGETLAVNDHIYFKESDGKWWLVDADVTATFDGVKRGICKTVAVANGTITVAISGPVSGFSGLTVGKYYASNTPGAIQTSAGTNSVFVGFALTTTSLLLDTYTKTIPSQGEKDAMAGGGEIGTPSSSNKFITENIGAVKGKQSLTAGETINGATLPVPVYQNDSDNEFYACDANDTSKLKFLGFAITDGTNGNPITVQFTGVVGGFTGLSEGEKYYVQDAVGTIGTTAGTTEVLVGVAISETQLMIQKGGRYKNGIASYSDAGTTGQTQTTVVTTGFRPSRIRMSAIYDDGSTLLIYSHGSWINGVYAGIYGSLSSVATFSDKIIHIRNGGDYWVITITSVTDTGFTITVTQNEPNPQTVVVEWEAEGEL